MSSKLLTNKNDVKGQTLPKKHNHGLSMPEVVNVWQEIADTLHRQTMKYDRQPQPPVPPSTAHCWNEIWNSISMLLKKGVYVSLDYK
jgi:hypothetical protein